MLGKGGQKVISPKRSPLKSSLPLSLPKKHSFSKSTLFQVSPFREKHGNKNICVTPEAGSTIKVFLCFSLKNSIKKKNQLLFMKIHIFVTIYICLGKLDSVKMYLQGENKGRCIWLLLTVHLKARRV